MEGVTFVILIKMNSYTAIDVSYLRSDRTIETVLVTNAVTEKVFFVYNYEGYSFRVCENL